MSGGVWVVSGWCLRVSGRCLGCMDVIWIENNWTRVIIWICFLFSQWPPGAEKEQNDHFTLFTVPVADFCSKWPVLVHYKVLGGGHLQILISPIYKYTLVLSWTGLVQRFYACVYWKRWRFGRMFPKRDDKQQTRKDRATQPIDHGRLWDEQLLAFWRK